MQQCGTPGPSQPLRLHVEEAEDLSESTQGGHILPLCQDTCRERECTEWTIGRAASCSLHTPNSGSQGRSGVLKKPSKHDSFHALPQPLHLATESQKLTPGRHFPLEHGACGGYGQWKQLPCVPWRAAEKRRLLHHMESAAQQLGGFSWYAAGWSLEPAPLRFAI